MNISSGCPGLLCDSNHPHGQHPASDLEKTMSYWFEHQVAFSLNVKMFNRCSDSENSECLSFV